MDNERTSRKKTRFQEEVTLLCDQASLAFNLKLLKDIDDSSITVTTYSGHDAYLGTITVWYYANQRKKNKEITKLRRFFHDISLPPNIGKERNPTALLATQTVLNETRGNVTPNGYLVDMPQGSS